MQIAELRFCRHRIYLTHISSFVLLMYIIYVEIPCFVFVMFVMGHTDPWIPCYHMIVHGQYGWLFEVHPGHLFEEMKRKLMIMRCNLNKIKILSKMYMKSDKNKFEELQKPHRSSKYSSESIFLRALINPSRAISLNVRNHLDFIKSNLLNAPIRVCKMYTYISSYITLNILTQLIQIVSHT